MYVCSSSSSSCCCKTADLYGFFWVVVVVTSFYTFIVFGFIVAFFLRGGSWQKCISCDK